MLRAKRLRSSYCLPALIGLVFLCSITNIQAASCPNPLTALGGEAWHSVSQIRWSSEGHNFEPNQSFHPGAAGRHVSNHKVTGIWHPNTAEGKLNWQLDTHYPFSGHWAYEETLGADSRIQGQDGFRPSAAEMLPARRHMRLINILQRFPALLLLNAEYEETENLCYVIVNHPTGLWRVWMNPTTGLPRRVVHQEQDPLFGEVENTIAYDDWKQIDGLWIPARLQQTVGNKLTMRERLFDFHLEQQPSEPITTTPSALARLAGEDVPDWAKARPHFLQRRAAAGAPMDSDPAGEVEFVEITPEIFQVIGGSHHNLIQVGRSSIVVIDAPWGPRRSQAVIKAINQRWPEKPISHLILTHHHNDHSAGLMSFVESGVSLVMGAAVRQYFGAVFARSGRRNIPNKTVADQFRLNAFGELIELYSVPNSHAEGMILVYFRHAKTLFTSDLYSPGRSAQHQLWPRELLDTIEWLNLDVHHIVGSHGKGAADMDDLRALVQQRDNEPVD